MLFNSINFLVFLPIVFILYWSFGNRSVKIQNLLLLVASYYFYASWDWRFLIILIFSTILDFFLGFKIKESSNNLTKKKWLWTSILINLWILGILKYFNFFSESLTDFLSLFGLEHNFITLNIILPLGISFYTLHGLSYVIDIYKNKIEPERNIINYAVFVSFFPLLIAGPIERAIHFLPQLRKKRVFHYENGVIGLEQIIWGFFKKIVIADNCAGFVDIIFHNTLYPGSTLFIGAILFSFQIYCDFSGYSDIAIGTAKLFGIDLFKNFSFPYFSRNIAEFWRRWHISLSSWFKDYLFIPLGGSKVSIWKNVRNIFIIFLVSGFWHGANWTFIIWGLLHSLYILPSIIFKTNKTSKEIVAQGRYFPSLKDFFSIIFTFLFVSFAWIFFRSDNLTQSFIYIERLFSMSLFDTPYFKEIESIGYLNKLLIVFIIIEWIGRNKKFAIENLGANLYTPLRWFLYYLIIISIIYFKKEGPEFIYFQF